MTNATSPKKKGRPATGRTKVKITATVPIALEKAVKEAANLKGESFSQFLTQALQTAVFAS